MLGWIWGDHKGPESSGDQQQEGEKSGGSSRINDEGTGYHHTDWSESGRSSWDEVEGQVEDLHSTPVDDSSSESENN